MYGATVQFDQPNSHLQNNTGSSVSLSTGLIYDFAGRKGIVYATSRFNGHVTMLWCRVHLFVPQNTMRLM